MEHDIQNVPPRLDLRVNKGDIERQQEEELLSKYPLAAKGSSFLQKKMQGKVKYFDSGDYNMALSKKTAALKNQATFGTAGVSAQVFSTNTVSDSVHNEHNVPAIGDDRNANPDPVKTDYSQSNVTSGAGGDTSHVKQELQHQQSHGSYSPPVALLCVATPSVAKELLVQQQISQFEESNSPNGLTPTSYFPSNSIRECTGDTMPTPDNVPAVRRKSVLLHQHLSPDVGGSGTLIGCHPSNSSQ
jgi:hypothetical protein